MKKAILVAIIAAFIGATVAIILVGSNLGGVIRAAIEKFGPQFTGTPVRVDSVRLSPRSGAGGITGLEIGNPSPYQQPFAIRLGEAGLTVDPASILSDKIVVRQIVVRDPVIHFEGGPTDNNLKALMANVDRFTRSAGDKPAEETGATKHLQVDEFLLSGVRVNVTLRIPGVEQSVPSLTLPDIRLTGLGSSPEGITPAELTKAVLTEVVNQVLPAVIAQTGLEKKLTEAAGGALDKASKSATEAIGKGLDGLFKK